MSYITSICSIKLYYNVSVCRVISLNLPQGQGKVEKVIGLSDRSVCMSA